MRVCYFLCCFVTSVSPVPQFEVYWESQESYLNNQDESHNPWFIDLGMYDPQSYS